MSQPRPAYCVAVLGSDSAPPDLVHARLDQLAAPVADQYRVCVVVRGDEGDTAAEWARRDTYRSVIVEPEERGRSGPARWAMRVASLSRLVVIFGDDRRWWRVARYAGDVGAKVVRVPVPAGFVATPPPRRVSWAFDPAADPLSQSMTLDGAGPGGYPD